MHPDYPLTAFRFYILTKFDYQPGSLVGDLFYFRHGFHEAVQTYYLYQQHPVYDGDNAEEYSYWWDEEKQGFHVNKKYPGKEPTNYFDSVDSHANDCLKAAIKKEIDKIEFLFLDKDEKEKSNYASNVQGEIVKLQKEVKKLNLEYEKYIIDALSEMHQFLDGYKDLIKKAPSKKLAYIFHFDVDNEAVEKFLIKLKEYRFINCNLPKFRRFINAIAPDQKIIWLESATAYKAFIDKLSEVREHRKQPYLEFKGKNKWLELDNVFILHDGYPVANIKNLKLPSDCIINDLEDCLFELDSANL